MGAANVIPGVSGGTVAFITGIYERLIGAIKSLNPAALKLLAGRRFSEFAGKTDLLFLVVLGAGVGIGILTLAKVLRFLFDRHAVLVWAFFFGLILASVIFVGAKVRRWGAATALMFVAGAGVAVGVALMKPVSENASTPYLILCGVVAMASMIIPGISGSFVLLLMGNYRLIMIESVAKLTDFDFSALRVLVPVGVGAAIGLVALSHFLAWIFKRFHDLAVSLLTGFVAGSLLIIWPWKTEVRETLEAAGKAKEKVTGYQWHWPDPSGETLAAVAVMAAGFALVWAMEKVSGATSEPSV
ncbi:MAG: DUF368 domain-containing protein [Verrucomicrobiae bacterium]|nr:DUF368 domain-containing protein [Verrucomicrobiae bacterium]